LKVRRALCVRPPPRIPPVMEEKGLFLVLDGRSFTAGSASSPTATPFWFFEVFFGPRSPVGPPLLRYACVLLSFLPFKTGLASPPPPSFPRPFRIPLEYGKISLFPLFLEIDYRATCLFFPRKDTERPFFPFSVNSNPSRSKEALVFFLDKGMRPLVYQPSGLDTASAGAASCPPG